MVTAIALGLSLPTDNRRPRQLQQGFAKIGKTVFIDFIRGLHKEIYNVMQDFMDPEDSPMFNLLCRVIDFFENDFDPEGPLQTTVYAGFFQELLDYVRNAIQDYHVKQQNSKLLT